MLIQTQIEASEYNQYISNEKYYSLIGPGAIKTRKP